MELIEIISLALVILLAGVTWIYFEKRTQVKDLKDENVKLSVDIINRNSWLASAKKDLALAKGELRKIKEIKVKATPIKANGPKSVAVKPKKARKPRVKKEVVK